MKEYLLTILIGYALGCFNTAYFISKAKGFDIVLRKSAALYIDPKYDITNEVIEGLNKRYNKVGGKVAPAPVKPAEAAPAKADVPKLSTEKPATPGKVDLKKKD